MEGRDTSPVLALIVDATECRIQRPQHHQRLFYSGHKKLHTLKYEIGIGFGGELHWVAGAQPGSVHDLTLLRHFGLLRHLKPHELLLADKAYIGEWQILTPFRKPETLQEMAFNKYLSALRMPVEHVFALFKAWKCLSTPWRHSLLLHPVVFYVIAQIVNIDMAVRTIKS